MFWVLKELSHRDSSFEYPQHMFLLRNKKNNFLLRSLIWGSDAFNPCGNLLRGTLAGTVETQISSGPVLFDIKDKYNPLSLQFRM